MTRLCIGAKNIASPVGAGAPDVAVHTAANPAAGRHAVTAERLIRSKHYVKR